MDFEIVLKSIIRDFINNGIRYALIGGYALGILGISRNTFDLDFLVDKRDKNKIKNILSNYQYEIKYESENVIQFVSILKVFGRLMLSTHLGHYHFKCLIKLLKKIYSVGN